MTTSSVSSPATADGRPVSSRPRVRLVDACMHYDQHVALAPTSLEIDAGSSVALVGANGSGKTTLLSMIAGLIEPCDGTAEVIGDVALVAQHRRHHEWMPLSVDEVLRMSRYGARGLLGRLRADDRAFIDAAAERLEVTHLRRRPFGELSGGQQQRVLVAQAIAADPGVLLLDEPITGLDLPSQLRILDVIDECRDEGRIVLFSTHHLAEARRAERVLLLAGCVLADGDPADVLTPPLLAEAFGGRLIRDDGTAFVVDDHGHDHDRDAHVAPHELGPHHQYHVHAHDHREDAHEQHHHEPPVHG